MNKWLSENWDKVLAMVISGIIGFFSAIITINWELAEIQNSLSAIDALIPVIQKDIDDLKKKTEDIPLIVREVESVKQMNDTADQMNRLLNLKSQTERAAAVTELRKMIAEAKAAHDPPQLTSPK